MKGNPRWLSKAAVLAIHERLLVEHGGAAGLIDESRLENALAAPLNHFAYGQGDLFVLAASYARALTKNHAFRDGNKRVALAAAAVFLAKNGFRLETEEQEAVIATVALSTSQLDEAGYAHWLQEACVAVPQPKPRARPKK